MPQNISKQPAPRRRFKRRSVLWFIAIFLLLAAGAAVTYWWIYRKQFVREQLELAVLDGSDGLYQVRYSKMRMDEVKGWIQFQDLEIEYDSLRFNELVKDGKAPHLLMRIKIPELKINGVKTPRALLGTELSAGNIEIVRPEVQLIYTRSTDSVKSPKMPTASEYDQILGSLDKIILDKLTIHDGTLKTGYLKSKGIPMEMKGVKLELSDIVVDSISSIETHRLLFARDIFVDCEEMSWMSGDNLYRFAMDSVKYQSLSRELQVQRFKIEPQLSEADFTRQLRFADDRFDLSLKKIKAVGLQLAALQRDSLLIDSLYLGKGYFHVYRDLGLPHDGKNRVGTYPHQLLKKAGIAIDIKTVSAAAIDIKYKERSAATRQAGVVHFANTSFRANDVNNTSKERNIMDFRIRSTFLNAPLNITWKFYTQANNGRFTIDGHLGQLPAPAANVLAEPMGPARLEEGMVNSINFFINGHDYGATGSVLVLYQDLKVALLKKDDDTKELNKKGLASFAANLMMKKSNPRKRDDKPRKAEVKFERDTRRSIFHLSWKTLFTGIKESVM